MYGERIAEWVVHVIGIVAALVACAFLLIAIPENAGALHMGAIAVYGLGVLAMIIASAIYNLTGEGSHRWLLRRFDHAAIFVMIAGSCTPIAAIGIGGAWGAALLVVVWCTALVGLAFKLFFPTNFERLGVPAYLALGWTGLLIANQLIAYLPLRDILLLFAGGLLFTLGVPIHMATKLPYRDAIWHALVIIATAAQYLVIFDLAQKSG